MKEIILDLQKRGEEYHTLSEKCFHAIEALQETCEHRYEETGEGHNKKYYTCTKCLHHTHD